MRITQKMVHDNLLSELSRQQNTIKNLSKQASSGLRIHKPEDSPTETAFVTALKTEINRLDVYHGNGEKGKARLLATDAQLQNAIQIVQRVHEIAVQAASATLNADDRKSSAMELEQWVREMVSIANSQYHGEALFSGFAVERPAFTISYESSPGYPGPMVKDVSYTGDSGEQLREIRRGVYIPVNVPGIEAFWAEPQRITSQTDSTGYAAYQNAEIEINRMVIQIQKGDPLDLIVDRINRSSASVHASIDNTTGNSLVILQSLESRPIMMRDRASGTILQDIGLVVSGQSHPQGENYAPSSIISGSTLFDVIVDMRNGMLSNDINVINRSLGLLAFGLQNLSSHLTEVGARSSRIQLAMDWTEKAKNFLHERHSSIQSSDIAKTIVELQESQTQHETSLRIGSRVIPKTMLNFID